MVANLIPKSLTALIEEGFWPRDSASALKQNSRSLVPESIIRGFAPEESVIFLYSPPFSRVRTLLEGSERVFWSDPRTALSEIDPDRTILIGDFGLGSDAPIALDYRENAEEPCVIRLRWADTGNHWIRITPTFAEFATLLKKEPNQALEPTAPSGRGSP